MIFLFFNYRASCVSYIMTGTFERNRFRGKFIYADQRPRTFLPISAQLNAILIVPISFTRAAVRYTGASFEICKSISVGSSSVLRSLSLSL